MGIHDDDAACRSQTFYGGALERIRRMLLVLGAGLTLATAVIFDWRTALGFMVGMAVSYLNFHWLERVAAGLLDRVEGGAARESGWSTVFRLLGRYVLVLLLAYGIFRGTGASLYGFLAGLFVPLGALMCEAAYEGWVAFRRGL